MYLSSEDLSRNDYLQCHFDDVPSVKERINLNLFSLPFIGERKYI